MLVFGLIREDAFKIASVAAHDWSMMQDGDIHLLDGPRQALEQKRTLSSGQDVTITETPRLELGPSRPRRRGPVDF